MLERLSIGYEWEVCLCKPSMMPLEEKDVKFAISRLRERLPWSRTGQDWVPGFGGWLLELRSGIMHTADEVQQRTRELFGEAKRLCEEKDWVFFPVGVHPALGGGVGLHVHLGSIHEYLEASHLADLLTPWAPALAALMANSPCWGIGRGGEFKSYRVFNHADRCSVPRFIAPPGLAQFSWGGDVQVKLGTHPTVEIRIADSASAPALVAEYVIFCSGLLTGLSSRKIEPFSPKCYLESLENRIQAARYGLQATFRWEGVLRPVSEVLKEGIQIAQPEIERLGFSELPLISQMVAKRQTQADFQLSLGAGRDDHHRFARDLATVIQDPDAFGRYLALAPMLLPLEPLDAKEFIYSHIEVETPYYQLYELLRLPYPVLDEHLRALELEGRIRVSRTPDRGALYSRQNL